MPGKHQMFYWDSCVYLSYINADPDRIDTLDAIFNDVAKSKGEAKIITSILTKVEVAFSATEQSAVSLYCAKPQPKQGMRFRGSGRSGIGFRGRVRGPFIMCPLDASRMPLADSRFNDRL